MTDTVVIGGALVDHEELVIIDDFYEPPRYITTEQEADSRDHPELLDSPYNPICSHMNKL